MIYQENLEDIILNRHKINHANELIILSGYIGFSPIQKISNKSELNSTIIYGCYKNSGVTKEYHESYCKISKLSNIKIHYLNNYNHSKIYTWYKNGRIVDALIGSANFSNNGLLNHRETLKDVKCAHDLNSLDELIKESLNDSQYCFNASIPQIKAKQNIPKVINNYNLKYDEIIESDNPTVNIFLGGKRGRSGNHVVGVGSKLNWGFGGANNNKKDAAIPIRGELITKIPNFFPNNGINPYARKGHNSNNHLRKKEAFVEFMFDDNYCIDISPEGTQGSPEGTQGDYYNSFSSYPSKSTLGIYLRNRLGLDDDAFIHENDLINYGRDFLTLEKIAEGQYIADFSKLEKPRFLGIDPNKNYYCPDCPH